MIKTTPPQQAINWITNVRVDLSVGSPLNIRIDFTYGPYYSIGDKIRLVDLDPAAGYVIGTVSDIKKYEGKGTFGLVEWNEKDTLPWNPQTF